ncbi:MAG: restriction endonuclease subunit S [Pseudoalteromonas nigrifaciens]
MSFFGNQSNWQLRSLKEIATLKRGYDLPTKLRTAGKVPIYAANGQNGSHNEAKIKGPGVITGRSGTIGKVHYTSTDYWPLNTSLYVTNFHGNDPKWVFYMLKAFQLERFVEGAGVPTLNRNLVHDELIPLPPLDEQKRIAAILDQADAIRRKRQQAIKLADDFLRSVFLDMFGEHFTTDGYKVSNKKKIKDLVDYIDYRGRTPQKSDSGIPLITAKNVKKGFVSEEPREFIPEKNYLDWMTRGLPREGDVLFTTEAPLGNAALLGCYDKVVVGQRLIALRSKGELTQEYLLYCLLNQFIQDEIYKRSSGSTVKGIRTKELYEIELPIPDIKLQKKFSKVYKKFVQSKHRLQGTIIESDNMFNSLSQKAFAG